jgi:hypothetical protein
MTIIRSTLSPHFWSAYRFIAIGQPLFGAIIVRHASLYVQLWIDDAFLQRLNVYRKVKCLCIASFVS